MNHIELVAQVAEDLGVTKLSVARVLKDVGLVTRQILKHGGSVTIGGMGLFTLKKRSERNGRNPRTGASIRIKAKKEPVFRATLTFKNDMK